VTLESRITFLGNRVLDDDQQTVENLFKLVNLIAEELLTRPKELEEIWGPLPEEKRKQVDERNARSADNKINQTPKP
jgi:hypothetical protein